MALFSTYKPSIGATNYPTLWNGAMDELDSRFGTAAVFSGTVAVSGKTYIGDNSNAFMTVGLTINQGASGDEALALKSSTVAHGITSETETDTYAVFKKGISASGGLIIEGYSEATVGLSLAGIGVTDLTDKNTAATGYVNIFAGKKSGAVYADPTTADTNLVVIGTRTLTQFIFDLEGSAHANVSWITFDKYDDVKVLDGLDLMMQRRSGVDVAFGEWVGECRDILQRERIFNFYDEGPKAMMNMTRMHMLEVGAIRQLGRRCEAIERKLLALEAH